MRLLAQWPRRQRRQACRLTTWRFRRPRAQGLRPGGYRHRPRHVSTMWPTGHTPRQGGMYQFARILTPSGAAVRLLMDSGAHTGQTWCTCATGASSRDTQWQLARGLTLRPSLGRCPKVEVRTRAKVKAARKARAKARTRVRGSTLTEMAMPQAQRKGRRLRRRHMDLRGMLPCRRCLCSAHHRSLWCPQSLSETRLT